VRDPLDQPALHVRNRVNSGNRSRGRCGSIVVPGHFDPTNR
jgi:hypothetical protein